MKYLEYLILESKQVGTIYHYTSIMAIFKILKENELRSLRSFLTFDNKEIDYISCTRNKNFHLENPTISSSDIRIELNGNLLSTKYKIIPRDDNWKRIEYIDNFNNKKTKLINVAEDGDDDNYGNEMEESILTKQIFNITKYINSITFYISSNIEGWVDEFKILSYFHQTFNKKFNTKKSLMLWFNKNYPHIKINIIIDPNYVGLWKDQN